MVAQSMSRLWFIVAGLLAVALLAFAMTAAVMAETPPSQETEPLPGPDGSGDLSLIFLPIWLGPEQAPVAFTHGVASGAVSSDGAVLWTRTNRPAELALELAKDADFKQIVLALDAATAAEKDHTVKVPATGLDPASTYYYRWRSGQVLSPTGVFKTAPGVTTSAELHFAFSGDSDGTLVDGQPGVNEFEVLDAARTEGLDFFVYMGDTIYSDSSKRPSGPAQTLPEYWQTYKTNRNYAALQALMAATSIYAIWDDHEVYNDYNGQTVIPSRYVAGRQAFLDYMPVQDSTLVADPGCAGAPMFRVFHWGSDVDLIILDERSCRSDDVIAQCTADGETLPDLAPTMPALLRQFIGLPPQPPEGCLAAMAAPDRTMLGPTQKALFKQALLSSNAKYKLVLNEVPIQQLYALPYDRWEGYAAERNEILAFLRDNAIENVIFFTTDAHANASNEVYIDFSTDNATLAYEFITGPIATSTFEESTLALLGPQGLSVVNALFDSIAVNCRHLDTFGYGSVVYDNASGQLTVTLKDDRGAVIVDQQNPSIQCTKTFGP